VPSRYSKEGETDFWKFKSAKKAPPSFPHSGHTGRPQRGLNGKEKKPKIRQRMANKAVRGRKTLDRTGTRPKHSGDTLGAST